MAEKIKRLYGTEDEAIIIRAKVILQHLQENTAAFTAKFPWFDAAFVNEFETEINAADQYPVDLVRLNNKKVLTDDVRQAMLYGDSALRTLGIYAKLTYPKDPERRYVFGQKTWAPARNNRKKMFDALTLAHSMAIAEPYKTDLATKGFTAANANHLLDLAEVLEEKKLPQGKAGKERKIGTADRIKLYNI